jgi:hypothetical protein
MAQLSLGSSYSLVATIETQGGSAFYVTCGLLAVWTIISTLEWIFNFELLRSEHILSWRVMCLRPGMVYQNRWSALLFCDRATAGTLMIRLFAGIGLLIPNTVLATSCLVAVALSSWFLSARTGLGGDGSDQMGYIASVGALLMGAGMLLQNHAVTLAGVLLIAGQLTLSYFIAGFSKVLSSTWRSGLALPGVMDTHNYGHDLAARVSKSSSSFARTFCWLVILGEMLFPFSLLLPSSLLLVVLFGFALFHISNAYFMGLNTFVWAFFATYPSVVLLSQIIRMTVGIE